MKMLNEIREGIVSEETERVLMSRVSNHDFKEEDAVHTFYKNAGVNAHNKTMLEKINSPTVSIKAITSKPGKKPLKVDPDTGRIEKTPFFDNLSVKIGARVCLTINVNTVDDLVNGALGRVVGIETYANNSVKAIIVRFDDENVGCLQRMRYPGLADKYKNVNGTPIFRHEFDFQVRKKHAASAKIIQIPLGLAWAFTSHKLQVITTYFFCQTITTKEKQCLHCAT